MKNNSRSKLAAMMVACTCALAVSCSQKSDTDSSEASVENEATTQGAVVTVSHKPKVPTGKPLTDEIHKALKYLAQNQNKDGGWGQGGGWRLNNGDSGSGGRVNAEQAEDRSDVGNTCMTMLAFLRAGEELKSGPYAEGLRKGAAYVMKSVDESDKESLFVTDVRDTQMQSKIGQYVDTFLALQLLTELKGQMADKADEAQRTKLVDKIIAKIEKNQQDNGAFAGNGGWASVLSQGICSRALNEARIQGADVSDELLAADFGQSVEGLDVKAKSFSGKVAASAPSSAGVQLYASSSKLRGIQANWTVSQRRAETFKKVIESDTASKRDKDEAREELQKIEVVNEAQEAALDAVAESVRDDNFVAGFGNNGGEEFLSYMNISESLRIKGGDDWENWDKKVTATINKAQNEDGSWAGHHCITGRNFCTAGALLTLMADRAPLPEVSDAVAAAK